MQRSLNALDLEAKALASTVIDWAYWDVTYDFARGEYPAYVDDNFGDPQQVLGNLNASFVVITDEAGDLIFSDNYNVERQRFADLPQEILSNIQRIAVSPEFQETLATEAVAGYMVTSRRIVVFATAAILPTDRQGESAGTFTFGRLIGDAEISQLSDTLRTQISLVRTDREGMLEDTAAAMSELTAGADVVIRPLDDASIAGFGLLRDYQGQPIAILKTWLSRDVWQQGQATIQMLAIVLLGLGIFISVITYLALDRLVVNRIAGLSARVDEIQSTGNLNQVLNVDSNDEIARLSTNINQMLAKLNLSQQELHDKNVALQKAMHEVVESARLKTEFLSVMSHELRTPLNAIIGYSGIMLNGINGELDDEATRMVGSIYDSSKHLLNLVNDILDLSKIDAGRLELVNEPYDIRALVNQLNTEMRVLADQKGLRFTTTISPDVPDLISGDKERVKQIVINLLSNAFKFTERGAVTLALCTEGGNLRIETIDTGMGIPAHALSYIFEDFRQVDGSTRRSQRGTGLGLSIVRKLATAMKGTVTVKSEVGFGSTFTVVLPIKMNAPENVSSPFVQGMLT